MRELVDSELPTFLPAAEMRPVQLDEACQQPRRLVRGFSKINDATSRRREARDGTETQLTRRG